MHTRSATRPRHLFLLFALVGVSTVAVFLAFDAAWLRNDADASLATYEADLLAEKENLLRVLVDQVFQIIDFERVNALAAAGADAAAADRAARLRVAGLLRTLRTEHGGYFWVNEIIDYEGGDGYARRFVHPNLPETEGSLLSTATRDADGRLPYLTELEGMKRDGELLQVYKFKKPDVDELGLKMSYARLYRDFDWVVATGVYLDDVTAQVERKRAELDRGLRGQLALLGVFTFSTLAVALGALLLRARWSFARIAELAERDSLTGLFNRRAGLERLEAELARGARDGAGFSVLMADIDRFKLVNDARGHEAGDLALRATARVSQAELRAEDVAVRWGGEEFLFILPGADLAASRAVAERIRTRLASTKIGREGEPFSVTVSAGLASWRPGDSSRSLVRRADDALYRAKAAGRNRIEADTVN
ncbi:MAG: diguanylate cyclase [Spirochaetales bacterium]|nr:diguanylate cyclase [Spirochaetales bacterium]